MSLRPYIAIVIDAFRAAMASNVLYVLLGLITLLLLAVAPLHMRETIEWEFGPVTMNPVATNVAKEILRKKDRKDPVVERIWERLSDETRKAIESAGGDETPTNPESSNTDDETTAQDDVEGPRRRRGGPGVSSLARGLVEDLNAMAEQGDFFDEEVWKSKIIGSEAQGFLDEGLATLSDIHRKRFHRLLINEAIRALPNAGATSTRVYYALWHLSFIPPDIGRSTILLGLKSTLSLLLDKGVMAIGLLIAIIVTANMIPDMFDPGSLNLLLSKPISRSGLLLSKFLGGTALIALCSFYLFTGLWLWMGIAVRFWDSSMLWSIPLYILAFAIYFSVSVFAGLVYRSAIVSVIVTGVFWAFCFAIGSLFGSFNAAVQNDNPVWAANFDGKTLGLNKFHQLSMVDPETKAWKVIAMPQGLREGEDVGLAVAKYFGNLPILPVAEPVIDTRTRCLAYISFHPLEFGQYSAATLVVYDFDDDVVKRFPLSGALKVVSTAAGAVLVKTNGTFFRLDLQKIKLMPPTDDKTKEDAVKPALTQIGPDQPRYMFEPAMVVANRTNDELVTLADNQLMVYSPSEDGYRLSRQVKVAAGPDTKTISAVLAANGDRIVIAFGNARVVLMDGTTLEVLKTFQPEFSDPPLEVNSDPASGKFLVLYRSGRLWQIDPASPDRITQAGFGYQKHISGIAVDPQNRLALCHSYDRVSVFENGSVVENVSPNSPVITSLFRYLIRPAYLICPKPSEFYKLVMHLSAKDQVTTRAGADLRESDIVTNPWSPLWSGLGFMAFMLLLSCVYFARTDC